jgi:hypothetical protein
MLIQAKEFINAADLIRPDIRLISGHQPVIDHTELNNREYFVAHQLKKSGILDTKKEFTVFINFNDFDWVLPVLKATWKLGGNIFVHDFHAGYTSIPEFSNFYNFVDVVVNFNFLTEKFADKISVELTEYDSDTIYKIADASTDITGKTTAVKTHSSGTTGIPKIIDYDHDLVRDLTQRLIPLFELTNHDKPFHWKTLHHASLFLNYAIPLLNVCRDHWFFSSQSLSADRYNAQTFFQHCLPFCKKNSITRVLVPYDWITNLAEVESVDLEGKLVLHCIRGIKKNQLGTIFQKFNPKSIVDIFGCSEQGVMFTKTIDQNNWQDFDPGLFDTVTPDLEYEISKNFIRARWPNRPWNTIGDIFQQTSQGLKYIGRSYSLMIQEETVPLESLDRYLRTSYHDRQYQLVADFEQNELYLAFFDNQALPNLADLNNDIARKCHHKLSIKSIRKFDVSAVNSGMKPSSPILLYAFRNGILNEETSHTKSN